MTSSGSESGPRFAVGAAVETVASAAEGGQYLTFVLAAESFGLPVLQVREILEFGPLTPVPLTPPWIRGVLNLRGNVVPVVDLSVKFGRGETRVTGRTCIVIVEVAAEEETHVMGVLVDSVNEVVELSADAVEAAPDFGAPVRVDYLLGMGKVEGQLVLLLDANRVLSTDELMATRDSAAITEAEPAEPGAEDEPHAKEAG